jgi:hypothetical protein
VIRNDQWANEEKTASQVALTMVARAAVRVRSARGVVVVSLGVGSRRHDLWSCGVEGRRGRFLFGLSQNL